MTGMTPQRLAVLGSGAGGQALAAIAALSGHQVRLYTRSLPAQGWPVDQGMPVVEVTGTVAGLGRLESVSDDLAQVLDGAQVVLVSVPAFGHEHYLTALPRLLDPGTLVVFVPGNYGGLRLLGAAPGLLRQNSIRVAQTNTLPFSVRSAARGTVHLIATKQRLVAAADHRSDEAGRTSLQDVLAGLWTAAPGLSWEVTGSLLEADLANVNAVLHVPLMLLNAASLSRTDKPFRLLPDGLGPAVDSLVAAADAERLAVAASFDCAPLPVAETLSRSGFGPGDTVSQVLADVVVPEARGGTFPDRRLSEEVPFGLWPLVLLGGSRGVTTPTLRALVGLAEVYLPVGGPGFAVAELHAAGVVGRVG